MSANLRQEILQQAVRLLAEGAEVDYLAAKSKAAKRLGYAGQQELPSNVEIQQALKKYQSIFHPNKHENDIAEKRREALNAMMCFEQFEPRLVGAVLEGIAIEHSPIEIHLFVDSPKDVTLFLIDKKIPYDIVDIQFKINKNESIQIPMLEFSAGEHSIQLCVFPYKYLRHKPIDPKTGAAYSRATLKKVKDLLAA